MAKNRTKEGLCPNCQSDAACYYTELLKETDLGVLQQEVDPEEGCWQQWVSRLGADPSRLIQRLQLPEREFSSDRSQVVHALLNLLEPVGRAPNQGSYVEPIQGYNLLFARDRWGEGYFLIGHGHRDQDVLDVARYDLVVEEARHAGVKPPYHVFSHRQHFSAPTIHLIQLGASEVQRLICSVECLT